MSYVIETGIPLLPRPSNGLQPRQKTDERKAIDSLELGQSVFFGGMDRKKINSVYNSASSANKPARYVTRAVDGGVRVWRVA